MKGHCNYSCVHQDSFDHYAADCPKYVIALNRLASVAILRPVDMLLAAEAIRCSNVALI